MINTTFAWSTLTPDIATIDADGVMHAWQVGTATFRATATDGTVGTYTVPMADPATSATAVWTGNVEFGEPIGVNDVIIRRDQFTSSYSQSRNIPNWVSAKLNLSHFGASADRCDCFTYDPLLPISYARYTTADYVGAGTAAGYGIDRGHLLRSFDVTASDGDNKFAYLFSNVVPQSTDLNTGPWAALENYLGTLARADKDVYMIAGASGSKGTVKNQGKITIPASVWKVAVIMPRGKELADVTSSADLEVIAVIMPNDPGIQNVSWETYKTIVDAVESLSGYDLLALLEDQIEIQVESGSRPPVAALDGPYTSLEGSSISMSAAGSSDPDGDVITYAWNFGDGNTASGVFATHAYAQDGSYTVMLTVTDSRGLIKTATSIATVSNVAPSIELFPGATLNVGEGYQASGAFTDPGADAWTATVSYGDGPSSPLVLNGRSFVLSHAYASAGTFTVSVSVSDGAETATRTQTVRVRARPVASVNGPFTSNEGSSVAMSAAASSDADGTIQSYAWSFGDGESGSGAAVSHVYVQDGSYSVTLTVTDDEGLTDVTTSTVTVANVAPVIAAFAGATLFTGETYTASGSFTDPGADTWSATVDYGDGTSGPLALTGKSFELSHQYTKPGTFSVVVIVSDGKWTGIKSAVVKAVARPVANISGTFSSTEGASIAMSGAGSSDADGTIQSYVWSFGDGSTAMGASVSHTYKQDGEFVVTLTVTDNDGLTGVSTTTAVIANVAPAIAAFESRQLIAGERYIAAGSFTDPGSDSWTATVNYGEGPTSTLALSAKSFALSHIYATAGTFTVTVQVRDDDVSATRTATATVMSVREALNWILDRCTTDKTSNKVESAIRQYAKGKANVNSTLSQLDGFLKELEKALSAGEISPTDAAQLRELTQRVINALSGVVQPEPAPLPPPAQPPASEPRRTAPMPRKGTLNTRIPPSIPPISTPSVGSPVPVTGTPSASPAVPSVRPGTKSAPPSASRQSRTMSATEAASLWGMIYKLIASTR